MLTVKHLEQKGTHHLDNGERNQSDLYQVPDRKGPTVSPHLSKAMQLGGMRRATEPLYIDFWRAICSPQGIVEAVQQLSFSTQQRSRIQFYKDIRLHSSNLRVLGDYFHLGGQS